MVELLAPVGNREMLVSAVEAGCDSVYFGVDSLNMRVNAKGFTIDELGEVVSYCHSHDVKAYLTVNVIVYDDEVDKVRSLVEAAKKAGVDAVICWDQAVIEVCRDLGMEIHLSTQASVANFEALKFYSSLGVKRVILARELSLKQIKGIVDRVKTDGMDVEVETFVHGAMCVAVSGRCFTSQFLYCKSANRGDCLQPCRRSYEVTDIETGDSLRLENGFVMSAKDLCALPFLDRLKEAGISVFKIEGRCRSPEYVKTVVGVYKEALRLCEEGEWSEEEQGILVKRLETVYNRKFSSGFYLGLPTADDFTDVYGSAATQRKEYVGYVENYFGRVGAAEVRVESNSISVGDKLMVIGPTTGVKEQVIERMEIDHKTIDSVSKGNNVAIKLDFLVRKNDKVYVVKETNK